MTTKKTPPNQIKDPNKPYIKLPEWLTRQERGIVTSVSLDGDWEEGRQNTGYEKLDLRNERAARWVVQRALSIIGNPPQYDAWLIRYPVGSEIPPHTDPSQENRCHVRLNALIIAGAGGTLCLDGEQMPLEAGDAYFFRPDMIEHSVTPVESGSRLVLSVGANLFPERAQAIGMS